ncbi:hypothetical protein Tco_0800770 [Tanacetum coccineum]|uniref:Retroviral polymerase SH3-like domain-containing protein n=1 Tax=Tanacetum coccineum TaxID=301880 RepID=A0ABQ4ZXF5_9ASTR
MGLPPATLGSEKTVSFQKSILGLRPKHIIVNKVKVLVASDNEVKQFYKPLSKPGVRFLKPNFRSKTPPPRRVNNNYSRPKTPQPKRHVGRQNQPYGFPVNWNNFPPRQITSMGNVYFHSAHPTIASNAGILSLTTLDPMRDIGDPNRMLLNYERSTQKALIPLTRHDNGSIVIFGVVIFSGSNIGKGYSQNSKAYIILNKHTRKVEESLNVTFDETPPPSKTSQLVDDDLDEEEAIKVTEKKNLENEIMDETLEIDEIVNIKESRKPIH